MARDEISTRIRIPADLHAKVKIIAEITGLSMNSLIVLTLRGLVEKKGDHETITKK